VFAWADFGSLKAAAHYPPNEHLFRRFLKKKMKKKMKKKSGGTLEGQMAGQIRDSFADSIRGYSRLRDLHIVEIHRCQDSRSRFCGCGNLVLVSPLTMIGTPPF
jgi:hypothetical protein